MRRLRTGVGVILAVIVVAFISQRLFGDSPATPHLVSSTPAALIGEGSEAVAVAGDGTILAWFPVSEDVNFPSLPLDAPPERKRLQGPALEQAQVLGATPDELRPYVEGSYYGESGVNVILTSGIELRFGNATQAARKWRAAAATLAEPSIVTLDYVNVHAPSKPSVGGSGHTLPPIP